MLSDRTVFFRAANTIPSVCGAYLFARSYQEASPRTNRTPDEKENPLWRYFQEHQVGAGIWKWEHYFEVYHWHLSRFVGQKANVLEVGIYSGGSLEMWHSYFGEASHIYGVDIEPACRAYANDHISVFIGDQADRSFWGSFRKSAGRLDILIDDGGHTLEQQRTTLEEMLPYLEPGGIYICEDVHREFNPFASFAAGLVHELNAKQASLSGSLLESGASPFQAAIHSLHFYPFLVVIEKHRIPLTKLSAPKHGTDWQPFLKV